jgi:hypothetical protein
LECQFKDAKVFGLVIDVEYRELAIIHRAICSRSRHFRPARRLRAKGSADPGTALAKSWQAARLPSVRFGRVLEKV